MTAAVIAVAGAVGALLGPALRAQIFHHAVPAGEPWRRACPHCGAALVRRGPASVLPLTGRCPSCAHRIGPRPGVVEVVAAATLGLLAWRVSAPLPLLALSWVAVLGVILGFVDRAVHRLPDRLTLPAFAGAFVLLGLSAVVDGQVGRLGWAVACAVAVAALYLVLILISPSGMGLGDGKTALSVGLITGWFGWATAFVATAAGFVFAGIYAAGLLVTRRAGRKDHIPHGPFMLLGAVAALLVAPL